jgi:hypothetical protein
MSASDTRFTLFTVWMAEDAAILEDCYRKTPI